MTKPTDNGMSRRDAVSLLGIGAGAGLVSLLGHDAEALGRALQAPGAAAAPVTFPRGAIIRTLLKDIAPESLAGGPTLFHEHLSINISNNNTPHFTADVAMMVEEARSALKDGLACIVDGGHPDMGTDLEFLKKLTAQSGLPIVASGGYYIQRTYPPELSMRTDDQIADDLAREAVRNRYGAFGEIGEMPDAPMSDLERKVFRAVGKAHVRTNLPIFTHNAYGTGPNVPREAGLHQLDAFESAGVKPQRVAIGHSCCLDDPTADVIKQIARRGAFVGFDRVTGGMVPDDKKVTMVLAFLDAGYVDNLLLSADYNFTARSAARPGYGCTLTVFVPKLRAAGVKDETIRRVTVDNPRRFLAFVPAPA